MNEGKSLGPGLALGAKEGPAFADLSTFSSLGKSLGIVDGTSLNTREGMSEGKLLGPVLSLGESEGNDESWSISPGIVTSRGPSDGTVLGTSDDKSLGSGLALGASVGN